VLVCFAVKEEAAPFRKGHANTPDLRILVTGMGKKNTAASFNNAIDREMPDLVLTCGFAGGLRPDFRTGTVLFECNDDPEIARRLKNVGAQSGTFVCTESVASTSAEKRALREKSNADAVEMESHVIQAICKEKNIPCVTVRVILDAADEDLPLNFNQLMTEDQKISYLKLLWALMRSSGKIGALVKFQKQTQLAANGLGNVLSAFVRAEPKAGVF
jgi:nucleoside phosphorylase